MEEYRKSIIATLDKAKEDITNIKSDMASNKKDVEEIKDIIDRLKKIELELNPKQKWMKAKIDSLDSTLKEVSDIKFDILYSVLPGREHK
jgi:predicted  nucleic acid-binding Zn-ribbon protein